MIMQATKAGRPKNFDTDTALEAATRIFWQQGYAATGVQELCAAMGIGKQSMYDWVGDKRGLYLACLNYYMKTRFTQIKAILEQDGSAIKNIRQFLQTLSNYTDDSDVLGCLVSNAITEFCDRDPEIQKAYQKADAYIESHIRKTVKRAFNNGELHPQLSVENACTLISTIRHGLMVTRRRGNGKGFSKNTLDFLELQLGANNTA